VTLLRIRRAARRYLASTSTYAGTGATPG
jgi:hypothetical protein